jgi:hypothetical protein
MHIDIKHHFMRDWQEKKDLDVRFQSSENNSADIMTNMTRDMTRDSHEKRSNSIRKGTLELWTEDVNQDSPLTEFTQSWTFSPESSPIILLLCSLVSPELQAEFRQVS